METPWIGVGLQVQDCEGNVTIDEAFYDPSLYQQSDAVLAGTWTTSSCGCWSGGTVATSRMAGATATFDLHGGAVALIGDRAANRGTANIYLDGNLVSTVDTSGAVTNRVVVFQKRWAAHADHTLVVEVVSGRVDIDGFVVVHEG